MFKKVLIANRGSIACRIIRTLKSMGIDSVAVYTEADADSLHVRQADEAICIGMGPADQSYLDFDKILSAAVESGAEAIHPGYGFLSENGEFAEACAASGIVFVGPKPQQMRDFGLKHTARSLAEANGVPMLPGSPLLETVEAALEAAAWIGYPIMLKSTAGGGGIGMRVCADEAELTASFDSVRRLAAGAFKDGGVFVEKYVSIARHIEVQIFGDGKGHVVALGERDCSAQRRNQKVVEETPAPGLNGTLRAELLDAAVRLAQGVGYQSAGTVEFIFDVRELRFYFLEVNTRLQVEHGVTEEVTGVDLVEWMVLQAAGQLDLSEFKPKAQGASIQVRLYAEDPNQDFRPSSGVLTEASFPETIRVETWVERGTSVSPYYDPLLAKIIAKGEDRAKAIASLREALNSSQVAGIETNLEYLRQVISSENFAAGDVHTKWLKDFSYQASTMDVLAAGTQTSVQDYPGRVGYWSVGVPPSGPMDDYAFRLANRLVGNSPEEAGLEMTLTGPRLRFNTDTTIALCGARMEGDLDGNPLPWWQAVHVRAGSILSLKSIEGSGARAYLAVRGGIEVPKYLGSRSTFSLGKFGGHAGRFLTPGDVLPIGSVEEAFAPVRIAPPAMVPEYAPNWEISVLLGPHAAPEFFTEDFMAAFFSADWKVHYNSNRLGIRLTGPKPVFARTDGGEAGLHPSNIHDCEYAIGTINFTGEMPVILGKDGPSLGGFVCPVTIVKAELWKIGQIRPGDTIRFVSTDFETALEAEKNADEQIEKLGRPEGRDHPYAVPPRLNPGQDSSVLHRSEAVGSRPEVVYRQAGDKYLLIEYGPIILDLDFRFRVYALMDYFSRNPLEGIIEFSPGVRSVQINYDSRCIGRKQLVEALLEAEGSLPEPNDLIVPSRIVRMPLAFNASTTLEAIRKYRQSVRDTAPWLPSNLEFIRRVNGLDSVDQVRETIFQASYMVMGLGDVYLGAPCAVPVDPRHRLVTTKYNPARTWTAEGEVGIGGVYMCVYGMESPGGYQLVGRSVPVWNTYRQTAEFKAGKPWLLRFFDQIQFYPMEESALDDFRAAFRRGEVSLDIEETKFHVKDYHEFMERDSEDIARFREHQQAAFEVEREAWIRDGSAELTPVAEEQPADPESFVIPDGLSAVSAPITGSIWELLVSAGDKVTAGQKLICIEAMKTEVFVEASAEGVVEQLLSAKGKLVTAGQPLLLMRESES